MQKELILYPVFAMVALTLLVWLWLYCTRVREMRRKHIPAQALATTRQAGKLLADVVGPSENFTNLFELPVLFYLAAVMVYLLDILMIEMLWLGWLFVVFRYAHSFIHSTYNRVMHRFLAYLVSGWALWLLWADIFYRVIMH